VGEYVIEPFDQDVERRTEGEFLGSVSVLRDLSEL
jgi:hypothetical protein